MQFITLTCKQLSGDIFISRSVLPHSTLNPNPNTSSWIAMISSLVFLLLLLFHTVYIPHCRWGKPSNVRWYHSSAQNTLVALDYSELNLKSYCCRYALCGMAQLCSKFICFCCLPFFCFNHLSPCCSLTKARGTGPPNLGNPQCPSREESHGMGRESLPSCGGDIVTLCRFRRQTLSQRDFFLRLKV